MRRTTVAIVHRRWGVSHWMLLLGLLAATVFTGCDPAAAPAYEWLDLSVPADTAPRGAVIFVVDGVNPRIFYHMLADGELPNIERYFVDRGLYVSHAVVNTPSVTIPNLTSIATGLVPGEHGVVGVNSFDRNQLVWRNYATIAQKNTLDGDYTAPTLYEPLVDRSTYSIFFQPHRGATKFFENWTSNGPSFFFGMFEKVDRTTLSRLGEVAALARTRGRWPAVTVCYLLAPDFRGYKDVVSSDAYRQALIDTDEQLGRVMGDFEVAGLLDDLLFVLTSDHGMVDVEQHFDLERFLREECDLSLPRAELWEKQSFERRLRTYQQSNAVLNCSGNRYAALQVRRPMDHADGIRRIFAPWPERPAAVDLHNYPAGDVGSINLLAALVAQEAIEAVAWSDGENDVFVWTKGGVAMFSQPDGPGGVIQYREFAGFDGTSPEEALALPYPNPLGWRVEVLADYPFDQPICPQRPVIELLEGEFATPERWLTETAGQDYADAPAQLLAYFRARRAGDIAIFAADGWDFRGSHRAGHGGMAMEELHVPLLITGPGIEPRSQLARIRRDSLVATVMDYLGYNDALDTSAASVYDLLPPADEAESTDE